MEWNQPPRKKIVPERVGDMSFSKACYGADREEDGEVPIPVVRRREFDARPPEDRVLDERRRDALLSRMGKRSGLLQFWLRNDNRVGQDVSAKNDLCSLVIFSFAKLSTVNRAKFAEPTEVDCRNLVAEMQLSGDLRSAVEEQTRRQGGCELWHDLRNGRLTSSRFGEILHRRDTTDPRSIVTSLMGYTKRPAFLPPAMKWGHDNEPLARAAYVADRLRANEEVVVRDSGLHLMEDMSFLGASSDGIVTCPTLRNDLGATGCLEIKCPYSVQNESVVDLPPAEIAGKYGDAFWLKKQSDGSLHLPRSHRFYAQVQGEMEVIGVEWCDFVVFSGRQVFVERIVRDRTYWSEVLLPVLRSFYVKHIACEILGGRYFCEMFPVTTPSSDVPAT